MTRRISVVLATFACALVATPAAATFHFMKIVEVFPGTAAEPSAQYVMLQMFAPGQNFVAGHSVAAFDATGTALGSFMFPAAVANGADLATLLIATPDAESLFGVSADLVVTPVIQAAGGAICWDIIECVAWGSFSATTPLPAPLSAPPFNAPTGLVPGMAMHRDLSSGGAVTAFVLAAPAPKNNAGQSGTLPGGPAACVGDCNGNGQVSVDEILTMVNIAIGNTPVTGCEAADANGDGQITINEILTAANNALNGCAQ